jgi:hypothetical protein
VVVVDGVVIVRSPVVVDGVVVVRSPVVVDGVVVVEWSSGLSLHPTRATERTAVMSGTAARMGNLQ